MHSSEIAGSSARSVDNDSISRPQDENAILAVRNIALTSE